MPDYSVRPGAAAAAAPGPRLRGRVGAAYSGDPPARAPVQHPGARAVRRADGRARPPGQPAAIATAGHCVCTSLWARTSTGGAAPTTRPTAPPPAAAAWPRWPRCAGDPARLCCQAPVDVGRRRGRAGRAPGQAAPAHRPPPGPRRARRRHRCGATRWDGVVGAGEELADNPAASEIVEGRAEQRRRAQR